MIRVNLLAEGRRPVAPRAARREAAARDWGQIALFGFVALGVVVAGAHWWLLHSTRNAKAEEITAVQAEVKLLEPIIKEVEQYETRKAELERRIRVINDLKANQKGPVRILDEVSRALPELLWLTSLEVAPQIITVNGVALNTNAIANFVESIDRVPEFEEPVVQDIVRRREKDREVFVFRLSFNYSFSPAVEAGEAAGEPDAPAEGT